MSSDEAASSAETKFQQHNFDADEKWQELVSKLDFSASVDPASALEKRKRKYFKQNYDDNLKLEKTQPSSSSSASSSSEVPQSETNTNSTNTQTPPPQSNGQSSSFVQNMLNKLGGLIPDVQLPRNVIISLNYGRLVGHLLVVWFSIIGFFLLRTSFGLRLYYLAMLLSFVLSVMNLFLTFGRPSMDQRYLLRVSVDDVTHNILYALIQYFSRPGATNLIPVVLRSLIFAALALEKGVLVLPSFSKFQPMLSPILSKINARENELRYMIAQMEIVIGFSYIISLLSPARDLVATFILWQYIRLRYLLSGYTRQVFSALKRFLDGYLLSPKCPAAVSSVYVKLCSALASFAEPPAQGQQKPSCSVM